MWFSPYFFILSRESEREVGRERMNMAINFLLGTLACARHAIDGRWRKVFSLLPPLCWPLDGLCVCVLRGWIDSSTRHGVMLYRHRVVYWGDAINISKERQKETIREPKWTPFFCVITSANNRFIGNVYLKALIWVTSISVSCMYWPLCVRLI